MTKPKGEHPKNRVLPPRRPFLVSLLFWILVLWVILGWLRFARAIIDRELIVSLLSPGTYRYLLLAGLSWGLVGLPMLWGILRRAPWTLNLLWGIAFFYPTVYWVERWLLWADPSARQNWPFMLLLTAIWFGLVGWVSFSKKIKKFFKKAAIEG